MDDDINRLGRRAFISALGINAFGPLTRALPNAAKPTSPSSTAIVPPGGNRFPYVADYAIRATPCNVTNVDSGGAFSAFENITPAKQGPPLHLHRREDEWFYVVSGRFLFEIDGKRTEFGEGGSVFAPRDLPHRWANTSPETAVLLVTLFPGGFEKFFDEISQAMAKGLSLSLDEVKAIYARHEMDLLGPPIFV